MSLERIGVIGAGAWGTALANVAARAGRQVVLWDNDSDTLASLRTRRESPKLPGIPLDSRIVVSTGFEEALGGDAVLLVVPAQAMRSAATALGGTVRAGTPVITCAKGIERGTGKFMTQVIAEGMPGAVPAILSGPSFAADVARGLPTAVTLAARDESVAAALAHALGTPLFRPYHSTDVRGVEIGGAAKNVLAIAAGIVAGRKLGASAGAALITRGFAELMRFGKAFGARPETLTGLSGLGDLILTCSSAQSRNFSLGVALGQGRSPAEATRGGPLAEGAFTAAVLVDMANKAGVDMPISSAVAAVVDGRLGVEEAIEALLSRPVRAED